MFRYHPHWTYFDHGMTVPPLISKEDAAPLVGRRDKASMDTLTEGHIGLAVDIVGRALSKQNLPAHLGEELLSAGLLGLSKAVPRLTKKVKNVRGYLSASIDNAIGEFLETDSLCFVPTRTQRSLVAKGKPRAVAPKITVVRDIAKDVPDDDLSAGMADEILSHLRRTPSRYMLEKLEDVYPFCQDDADRDIVDLRYDDGAGPRCLEEVADLVGVALGEVKSRLDRIEDRLYADLDRKKPKDKRARGKRIFSVTPKSTALVSYGEEEAHSVT